MANQLMTGIGDTDEAERIVVTAGKIEKLQSGKRNACNLKNIIHM